MDRYSAVIIANNEEGNIGACINSLLEITEDIVLVDSGSTDRTIEIARELGARVYEKSFTGYGANKNFGNEQANLDWIISLDGDEVLSADLIEEIKNLQLRENHVYALNSLVNHSGIWIRHSGWYPRYKNRIFNRLECKWNDALVHEDLTPLADKSIIRLNGDLHHFSYSSKEDHRRRIAYYAELKAREWLKNDKKIGWLKRIVGPAAAFCKTYFLKMGLLDGSMGWFIARMDARMYRLAIAQYHCQKTAH